MFEPAFQRRLAAIMFTDIEGYTALMQRSEQAALDLRARHRGIFHTTTVRHHGEVVQYYGDGTLSLFPSAVDAVRCALALQQQFKEAAIPVRIGIHEGDILTGEEDIVGDGVNIAARLESIAEPGAILFSEEVRHEIANQDDLPVQELGTFHFRNVARPRVVFALASSGLTIPTPQAIKRRLQAGPRPAAQRKLAGRTGLAVLLGGLAVIALLLFLGERLLSPYTAPQQVGEAEAPILLVLPFENLSGDSGQDYLASGMADEIRSRLAGVRDLRVIPRTSSQYVKDRQMSIAQIAQDMEVDHILEGTVQRQGDILRISVQLNDAKANQLTWSSAPFHGKMAEVFAFQEKIAREVVEQLRVELTEEDAQHLRIDAPLDPEVYDLALRAESTNDEALWKQVLSLDSTYVRAYYALAGIYMSRGIFWGLADPDSAKTAAEEYLAKALAIAPDYSDPIGPALRGSFAFYWEWDFEQAQALYQEATRTSEYGLFPELHLYLLTGQLDKAMQRAEGLQAYQHLWRRWQGKGLTHGLRGEYDEALANLRTAIIHNPKAISGYMHLGQIYLAAGYPDSALATLEQGIAIGAGLRPPFMLGLMSIAAERTGRVEEAKTLRQELVRRWENRGPAGSPAFALGMAYSALGDKEKAFQWLERSFDGHEVEMIWLKMEPQLAPLHSDPRYGELLRRVGFP